MKNLKHIKEMIKSAGCNLLFQKFHNHFKCHNSGSKLNSIVWALLATLSTYISGIDQAHAGLLQELYFNIPGTSISDLTNSAAYPSSPSQTNILTDYFEGPINQFDNYGQRIHGYVSPPVTGKYTFWIASDDNGQLFLSTDDSPANMQLIASVNSWTSSREWNKEPNQQSAEIYLQAGRLYYICALQKEGTGGDNLAVRWLRPDGVDEAPIPASYFTPWGVPVTPPIIIEQPSDVTVTENQPATFTVKVSNQDPIKYQWRKGNTNVPGAIGSIFTINQTRMSDNGALISCVLSNSLGTTNTRTAVLTVLPDTNPPVLVSAINIGTNSVQVKFNEPIDPATGTNKINYSINNEVSINSVTILDNQSNVLLFTTPLQYGVKYTLTVSNIRDQATNPNTIAPNSSIDFTPVEYTDIAIGSNFITGKVEHVPGGCNVSGSGNGATGTSDQFQFGYKPVTGDFDLRARVDGLEITDPFVQASIIARESLDSQARFAGVFASSAQLGCFFEYRATAATAASTAAPVGGFPVNYPQTWLRLKRSGSTFTGYAGFDGTNWVQLGSVSISMPGTIYFGLAASSRNTNRVTTVRFRDIGTAPTPKTINYKPEKEPLGPSNRRTGLVISEIMYNPLPATNNANLEFIEIYNAESIFVELTGWKITGDIEYEFPQGFQLEAGQFAVIAADPAAVESFYKISGVLGPYNGKLPKTKGKIVLRNKAGAIRWETEYSSEAPWPAAAAGGGHSLVLAKPSYGENDFRAWAASELIGGSPGEVDAVWFNPYKGVVINEILANSAPPNIDFVELYNKSNFDIDISGCVLTDNAKTNKFIIPSGTIIKSRSFITFSENQLGFALKSSGETIYLISPDRKRIIDCIKFAGQEQDVSLGRYPDGSEEIKRLADLTPGSPNAPRKIEPVVINEIMYHPINNDNDYEFVELYNNSSSPVDLSNWQLAGDISFEFPQNSVIQPDNYVVVAKNISKLLASYTNLNNLNTFGNFKGSLKDSVGRVTLLKPEYTISTNSTGLITNKFLIPVCDIIYRDGGRWPELADGGGSSLELIDPRSDPTKPSNWAASDETAKAPWTTVQYTGKLEFGNSSVTANRFQIIMLGKGECLIDDIQVLLQNTNILQNGDFERTTNGWAFQGNHSASTIDNKGSIQGNYCLHVRAQGDGDTGVNSIRGTLTNNLTANQTVTIKAKVRWLAGWPEVLFRVRGNWIEVPVRMELPPNLGTPGQKNSKYSENAGPAIFNVSHWPALPMANEQVKVTCQVDDPDGVVAPTLKYRKDPNTSYSFVSMNDNGTNGDEVPGDGVFTGIIPGQAAGTLIAFSIIAYDDANPGASSVFPELWPTNECLIRWGDPVPFGTFSHYHMWNTYAVDQARSKSIALDNTYRNCTLVYKNFRIIYNAGFRDKGSPYHGGAGDWAVTVPKDDLLLGTDDRVFASTGNGGNENTGMCGDISAWIAHELGIPYLHSHYMLLYRNGSQFREILYDLEQPNRYYAKSWFPPTSDFDELYKIAVWFEFQDNNQSYNSVGATLEKFMSGNSYKTARYRWNWQIRPGGNTANNFTNIFDLVTAANLTTDKTSRLLTLTDMEEWMRVFAFNRLLGNWDSWTYNVGQNMYIYFPPGQKAVLMPWDIDFVLGLGDGTTAALWGGGQDPVAATFFNITTFRRMLWRAYIDAVNGPMQSNRYQPQLNARRAVLLKNNIQGLVEPTSIRSYIEGRRNYIVSQLKSSDSSSFVILTSSEFTNTTPLASISGNAPFAVATIEVNGVPYPVTWSSFVRWQINVPLTARTNILTIVGKDLRGNIVPGASNSITVYYEGEPPNPKDWIVINEIMYNAPVKNAEFVELYNRSLSSAFDLSGWIFSGLGLTIPQGTIIQPNGFLVFVKDPAAFALAYGATNPVAAQFPGNLDKGGETLTLLKPTNNTNEFEVIDVVRYDDDPPWPITADGLGPSLQLIDPNTDNWRVGNWAVTDNNSPLRATPGKQNSTRQFLDPFPEIWINEILPNNSSINADNSNQFDPWIELFNSGDTSIDLSELYLSDDTDNLLKWRFPSGAYLAPNQFLIVWCDAQPEQTTQSEFHTNFKLNPTNGIVLISRLQFNSPAVVDYLTYNNLPVDKSIGLIPDGNPRTKKILIPTPASPNIIQPVSTNLFINEWMPINQTCMADPADGKYQSWFELFNPNPEAIDLSGFSLSISSNTPNEFVIPDGTVIPANGFLIVWADAEPSQNSTNNQLHANFTLTAPSGQINLFNPDGFLIDSIQYTNAISDQAEGRYPDGNTPPFFIMNPPTPGEANQSAISNKPPFIQPIADITVFENQTISFKALASDPDAPPQLLSFELVSPPNGATIDQATGVFNWTPSEVQGPGKFTIGIKVSDNGTPSLSFTRFFNVNVLETNSPPVIESIPNFNITEHSNFTYQVIAKDSDIPQQQLIFSLGQNAPAGAQINPATGLFSWTPDDSQGGQTFLITIIVSDNGTPPMQSTQNFNITVIEVQDPPVISPVTDISVNEGDTVNLTVQAYDPDPNPVPIVYSLDNAPGGAKIDPETGLFTWTTTEADGPRDYNVTIRVTKKGTDLSSTISFVIGVKEVNSPPILMPIQDYTLFEGASLTITNYATDPDIPAQNLTFSSPDPLPDGVSLNPQTGMITVNVPYDALEATNIITVMVKDNGEPPMSATQTFKLIIKSKPRLAINEIMHKPSIAGAEFVELFNYSTTNSVNIGNWLLQGYDFVFPSNTIIAPQSYLCVAANLNAFTNAYGTDIPAIGNCNISIPAKGGIIRLIKRSPDGIPLEIVDEVQFSLEQPWPTNASQGASLQLIDPTKDHKNPANWIAMVGQITNPPVTLVQMTNSWRYYQDATAPPANWMTPAFDDSSWPKGNALLYVENAELSAPKNTPLTLGQITYYFRSTFVYNGNPSNAVVRLWTMIDDGAVIYLNGQELTRIRMPDGSISNTTFALSPAVGDAQLEGPFDFTVHALQKGTNLVSAEVHQVNATSSDIVFGAKIDIIDTRSVTCTPGTKNATNDAFVPIIPKIWINEVMPNNSSTIPDNYAQYDPWIELVNLEHTPVNLSNFALSNDPTTPQKWIFPPNTYIPANGYLLIWADAQTNQTSGNNIHTNFRLNSTNCFVSLAMNYGNQWYVIDSLQIISIPKDNSFGSVPDGNPTRRQVITNPTPNQVNKLDFETKLNLRVSTSSNLKLGLQLQPGLNYNLQFSPSLDNPQWQTILSGVALNPSNDLSNIIYPTNPAGFYRVILTQ